MLIDDDRFLLDMYTLKFANAGCAVDAMTSAEHALEKLRTGVAPDIILLDIVMPAISGFDFLETVKKEGLAKTSSIIMLSNQGQDEDVKKATALGAAGYIVKASSIPSEVLEKALAIADVKK
jgi:DNA-binding response OmpR family regulator